MESRIVYSILPEGTVLPPIISWNLSGLSVRRIMSSLSVQKDSTSWLGRREREWEGELG